jgi:hypothetical protein
MFDYRDAPNEAENENQIKIKLQLYHDLIIVTLLIILLHNIAIKMNIQIN